MKRIFCLLSFCLVFWTSVFAESPDSTKSTESATVWLHNYACGAGIGAQSHHTSYLSPLLYSGISGHAWIEILKHKSIHDRDFYSLLEIDYQLGILDPSNEETKMISEMPKIDYNMYYDLKLSSKFHMLLGAYAGIFMTYDKLPTNSNNTEFLNLDFDFLGLSVRPTLSLRSKKNGKVLLSNQMNFRLLGLVSKTPFYTQSYYDQYLSENDVLSFNSFNSFTKKMRFSNKFMADLPAKKVNWRLGFLIERSTSLIKMVDCRNTNIQFLIGFSYDYIHFMGRKGSGILNNALKFKTVFED